MSKRTGSLKKVCVDIVATPAKTAQQRIKKPEMLNREAYARTEALLSLHERKLQEGVRIDGDELEGSDITPRDLRILIQNIQDLQTDLQRLSMLIHGRAENAGDMVRTRENPLLELMLRELAERFHQE